MLFLSPEEVQELADKEEVKWEDEEDLPLWEELANAVVSLSAVSREQREGDVS